MVRFIVLVVLALVAAVNAQKPVCTPDQFMGGQGFTIGQVYPGPDGRAEGFNLNQYGAWDFANRRLGINQDVYYPNGTTYNFRLVQDYVQGIQWVIFDQFLFCAKTPTPPEPSNCLPPNTTVAFRGFLGGAKGVFYDTFVDKVTKEETGNIEGDVTVSVARDSYIPLSNTFIGTYYDGDTPLAQVSTGGWFNVEIGISDPKRWFDLPAFCNEAHTDMTKRPKHIPDLKFLPAPRIF